MTEQGSTGRTVTIQQGRVRGRIRGGVEVFAGIPFAEAPVGRWRFRAPRAAAGWAGVRACDDYAPKAMQGRNPFGGGPLHPTSEDCLALNVFAPRGGGPHPVLVWIHGGANTIDGTANRLYDASALAAGGLVVVTVAYRLGPLGFLRLRHLLGDDFVGSENNALRDLDLATKWVVDNVEAFGGNPSKVTLAGESAGAKNALNLLAMPSVRHRVRGVISESGSPITLASEHHAERVTSALLRELGMGESEAERLLTMDAARIVRAANGIGARIGRNPWRPVVDGAVLHTDTITATRAGELVGVAALLGTNANEFDLFAMGRALDRGDPTVAQTSHLSDPATLERVLDEYRALYAPTLSPRQIRIQLMTAEEYWIPSVRFAETHAAAGGNTWMYRFDWRPRWHPARLRASHMMELPFVFDAFDRGLGRALTLHAGPAEHALSQRVRDAWTSFARDHEPTTEPEWSTYGTDRHVMTIDRVWRQRADPLAAERRLWDGIL